MSLATELDTNGDVIQYSNATFDETAITNDSTMTAFDTFPGSLFFADGNLEGTFPGDYDAFTMRLDKPTTVKVNLADIGGNQGDVFCIGTSLYNVVCNSAPNAINFQVPLNEGTSTFYVAYQKLVNPGARKYSLLVEGI